MEWIRVDDRLPEIPEGKFGVGVLVAEFDKSFKELCGGDGYTVREASYGYTEGHKMYEGSNIKEDFMSMYIGGKEVCCFGPMGDVVTHWMPLPEPPKEGA